MALNTEDNHAVNCRCKRGGGGGGGGGVGGVRGGLDRVPIKYKVCESFM